MKTIRILLIILVFSFVALLFTHNITSINQDIGRHLKSGQTIWETNEVYKTNLFSYTEPDHEFINHHWLSEVVFFLLYRPLGLEGMIIFKAAVLTLAFILLWLAVKNNAKTAPWAIATILGSLLLITRSDLRPEIFSYLFLSFFLFAVFRAKYQKEFRYLKILPLIQVFWVNAHIYFAIGPAIIFLFLVDRLLEKNRDRKVMKMTAFVFLFSLAANLINPNFIKGALEPFNILRNYGYLVAENQSIFFLQNYGILTKEIAFFQVSIAALLVSFILAVRAGHKKIFMEGGLVLMAIILAIKMERNFGLYALILMPVLALNLGAIGRFRPAMNRHKIIIGYLALCTVVSLLIAQILSGKIYRIVGRNFKFGTNIPRGAEGGMNFVKDNEIKGPVFNNFDVGSFLIWKLYPEQRVFVDGRPEAYSVEFFEKIYKPMQESPELWEKYSEQYGINYIFFDHHDMTPWAQKFLDFMSDNDGWPLVYEDNSTVIFLKRTAQNKNIIKQYLRPDK